MQPASPYTGTSAAAQVSFGGAHPNPRSPWNMSPTLFGRVRDQHFSADGVFRACEVLSSDPEYAFIIKYFELHKPLGLSIRRIICTHTPAQTEAFVQAVKRVEKEALDPANAPHWTEEKQANYRERAIRRWHKLAEPFSPVEVQTSAHKTEELLHVKVAPLWYNCEPSESNAICSTGFKAVKMDQANAAKTKKGYSESARTEGYGKGIYFTDSARYAAMLNPQGHLFLAWVAMREPYPVINDIPPPRKGEDMQKLQGKGPYQNYSTHYIPLSSLDPFNPRCKTFFPCYAGGYQVCDEVVIFEKQQALARFRIELGSDLPMLASLPETDLTAERIQILTQARTQATTQAPKDKVALFELGESYEYGHGGIQDLQEAVKWYRLSAEQNYGPAQLNLGICYYKGKGVDQNHNEAVRLYKEAAKQNILLGQYFYAACCYRGEGIERNLQEAVKFYRLSAEQGHRAAQYYLGECLARGKGVEKDRKEALLWFQKAAAQGDKDAQTWVQCLSVDA